MIGIIGPGAVGMGLASLLLEAGENVAFVGRRGTETADVNVDFGKENRRILVPVIHSKQLKEETELVFITVKAYDLATAIASHLSLFRKGIPLVSLCNGAIFTVMDAAGREHSDYQWRIGTATLGIKEIAKNHYAMSNPEGVIAWGEKNAVPTRIESTLFNKQPLLRWLEDPNPALQKKWLFNTVLNSLCAAHNLAENRLVLEKRDLLEGVFKEAYILGEKTWGPWSFDAPMLYAELLNLIEKTGTNENSMRRDVRLKKRNEVDFMSGLANGHPDYPQLNHLTQQIKASTAF